MKILLSFFVVVWFTGSVIAMITFSHREGSSWLVPVLLGQFFAMFGIIGTAASAASKKIKGIWLPLLFTAVGASLVTLSLIYHFGSKKTQKEVIRLIPVLAGICLFLGGTCSAAASYISGKRTKEKYTTPVEGTCTDLLSKTGSNGSTISSPVYEIFINGETVTLEKGVYSNMGVPTVGEIRTLYIDPGDLESYFEPIADKRSAVFVYTLSAFFIIGGAALAVVASLI